VSVSTEGLPLAQEPPVKLLRVLTIALPMATQPRCLASPHKSCVTLYRPTGEGEMALVRDGGWKSFPPRLPDQPISIRS
jgi:hypothetical protein